MGCVHPQSATEDELFVTPPASDASSGTGRFGGKFHALSGLPTSGYAGALSEKQRAALALLRKQVDELGLSAAVAAAVLAPAEDETGFFLRFLRARQFDVEKALALLRLHLEWRESVGIQRLGAGTEAEALGCDPALIHYYLPTYMDSTDLQGRNVTFSKWGDLRVDEMLKSTSHEGLARHHIWQQEQVMRRLARTAKAQGVWITQCVSVIDANHWHPSLASRAAMSFLHEIALMDSTHYPERLGLIAVINAPYTLSAAWAVISGWLDPVTRKKVQILSGERYWKPLLASVMAPDQIPLEYGGTLDVRLRDLKDGSPPPQPQTLKAQTPTLKPK
jgi:hypothetical protein